MAEVVTAEKWLYGKLTGDVTLMALVTGVYTYPVPESAVLPYVLVSEQSAQDVTAIGPHRIMVNGLWTVRVVAEAKSWGGNLQTAADRMDVLLQASAGAVTGGNVWACWREQPLRLVEVSGGQQIRFLGGVYRMFAK